MVEIAGVEIPGVEIPGIEIQGGKPASRPGSTDLTQWRRIRSVLSGVLVLHAVVMLVLTGFTGHTAQAISVRNNKQGILISSDQSAVITQRNDNGRTGANLNETILKTSNVNSAQFGKLFSRAVDGQMYAQPLFVPNVAISQKGTLNVVFAVTEHNSVYAFDADDPATSTPLWQASLGEPVPSTDISPDYADMTPEIGITSTPVIDLQSNTMYVVAKSKDAGGFHQRLHALDISTGIEKFGGPAEITASVGGAGDGSVDGTITFDPLLQLNRPALLLVNGIVYIAFGSHGDIDPYHGWLMAYDATTLRQLAVYNTTPDGGRGSIWMSGQGPAADQFGNVYVVTANGTCDAAANCGLNLGESFIKLTAVLTPADWFTPSNRAYLDEQDLDIGSGGAVLLPDTSLVLAGGKDGTLRLVDTNKMGRFNPSLNQDVQEFGGTAGPFLGSPVYWNSAVSGPTVYVWGGGDYLKAYRFTGAGFQTTPISQSGVQTPEGLSNTAPLSLSGNGGEAGSGIIWASCPDNGDANKGSVPGILRAFDASDVSKELWNSRQNQDRDDAGRFAKFCPPTVAGGKVYLASFSSALNVYGLLDTAQDASCTYSMDPITQGFRHRGGSGTITVTARARCVWTAATDSSWITITSGNTATGSGTLGYTVEANDSTDSRTGTITMAGGTFTVVQRGRRPD